MHPTLSAADQPVEEGKRDRAENQTREGTEVMEKNSEHLILLLATAMGVRYGEAARLTVC